MTARPKVDADQLIVVTVKCPACNLREDIQVGLASRLERAPGSGQLSVKVKQTKVDHACGQLRISDAFDSLLTVDHVTGEIHGGDR